MGVPPALQNLLVCPLSGEPRVARDDRLVSPAGQSYPITTSGIPAFVEAAGSEHRRRAVCRF
jgi:hypothetical protein